MAEKAYLENIMSEYVDPRVTLSLSLPPSLSLPRARALSLCDVACHVAGCSAKLD